MQRRDRHAIEELDQLLAAGVPGDAPRELAHLAELAGAVRGAAVLERPDPAFRTALRSQLLDAVAVGEVTAVDRLRDRVDVATARIRHSARAALASALASTMIGSTGVALAAQEALPGDLLYGVKRLTESARLAFTADDVEEGRLHLRLAGERLEEVEAGHDRLADDQLTDALADMDTATATGADLLLAAALAGDAPALTDELLAFAAGQAARVGAVYDELPLAVQPAADRSLELLRRIEVQVQIVLDPACARCDETVPVGLERPDWTLPSLRLPGDGAAAAPAACDCSNLDPTPTVRDPEAGTPTPTPPPVTEPEPEPEPQPAPAPAEDDRVLIPELPGPLDPIGDVIDDVLGGLTDQTGTTEVVSEVGDVVEDVVDEVVPDEDPSGTGLLDDLLGG